jgi:hypothetical protein
LVRQSEPLNLHKTSHGKEFTDWLVTLILPRPEVSGSQLLGVLEQLIVQVAASFGQVCRTAYDKDSQPLRVVALLLETTIADRKTAIRGDVVATKAPGLVKGLSKLEPFHVFIWSERLGLVREVKQHAPIFFSKRPYSYHVSRILDANASDHFRQI